MNQTKRQAGYYVLLGGAFLWCALLFLPPFLAASGYPAASRENYAVFSTICHQYDSRSLHIFGHKLAVCARCSGVYLGFLAGVLAVPLVARKRTVPEFRILIAGAIPMILDVFFGAAGLTPENLITRHFTGLFFGVVSAFALTPLFEEAFSELMSRSQQTQGICYESKT
jgi:uncharacterized membrane protein